jgi:hypothetical protein
LLGKSTRKNQKKHAQKTDYDTDSDIRSNKHYKAKKEFEYALNDEIEKEEEVSKAQNKFKRDDSDDTEY